MLGKDHDIRVLNSLIATTFDSIDGYREAAKDVGSGRFATIFTARAAERVEVATRLQAEVSRLGGEPENSGTALGAAHRVFLNLKDAVTGSDEKAIVDEVERGEDHIKRKFEEALADTDLSPETRAVIRETFTSVKRGHDEASALKHSLAATH
ncbi:hypothetical protein CLG96_10925 [Sphingomonas oleivorans]|uniref:DUF2383 domain-containing protein n=1 Tax=Sphingomonas oleivorans TaxID=1735121 RepID=A0A2T5FXN4_9SPHN|nr:PA2169 family four-helix-bundle protein [Sphingomonas oleivorans]PTQ10891.1 hypothetical protein CLG96_10925 [Sphingomonas oleivorans]